MSREQLYRGLNVDYYSTSIKPDINLVYMKEGKTRMLADIMLDTAIHPDLVPTIYSKLLCTYQLLANDTVTHLHYDCGLGYPET